MTPNEFQQLSLITEKTPDFMVDSHKVLPPNQLSRLVHAAMGMQTEAAELTDMLKKHTIYGKTFDPVNVLEEVGDTLWYAALALSACGYTMEQSMETVIAKLKKRYPEGFTEEAALKRNLDKERQALEAGALKSK